MRPGGWRQIDKPAAKLGKQPLQRDRLFAGVNRDGGVAIVDLGAAVGNLPKDRIALDDVQSNAIGGRKNAQNDVVGMDDGFQCPNFITGRSDEIAGLGRELTQFFELGHCVLQRN